MNFLRNVSIALVVLAVCFFSGAGHAFAVNTGTIDPVLKYSQFLDLDLDKNGTKDFINWNTTNGGVVTVSDTAITGYVWGDTVGWINLYPANAGPDAGVKNNCDGVLSGYAWGENAGWINFAPTFATGPDQPKINTTTGAITGTVWSENYGWIQLNSTDGTNAGLQTTWHGCSTPVTDVCIDNPAYPQTIGVQTSVPANFSTDGSGHCTPNINTGGGCPAPQVWNPQTLSCVNPPPTLCTPPQVWDSQLQACVTPPLCTPPQVWDPQAQACVTPPPPVCVAPYVWNGTSCALPTHSCTAPQVWNPQTQSCVTPPTGCTAPQVWNGTACVTPPPPVCVAPYVWNGTACVIVTTPPGGGTTGTTTTGTTVSGTTSGTGKIPLLGGINPAAIGSKFMSSGIGMSIIAIVGLVATFPGFISRFTNLILSFLFARKRARGVVYDSQTKEPLDPAYVSVIDLTTGQEVATQITDMEGRYGFVLKKGTYRMMVSKTHYQFPSARLAGKKNDELYDNLYFGEAFTVVNEDEVITMNIPMDPIGTDWNQQEKRRMNFVHYLIYNLGKINWLLNALFVLGFMASLVITYYYPVWWNILMTILYVVVALLELVGFGPITAGKITKNGMPLPYAIVRVYNANLNREVAHKVTTQAGGYYILVPRADYYVTIEQKNPDGTYTHIFTSNVMRASNGIIHKSFMV